MRSMQTTPQRRVKGSTKAVPKAGMALDGDPRTVAQGLVAQLPLREIFQKRELADAFLSELMLALARESSRESRRELQREGIERAKAQGVRFGKPSRPLPENFEKVCQEWQAGVFSLREAAKECGMPESTFYNAAQRREKEKAAEEAEGAASRDVAHEQPPAPLRRRQGPQQVQAQAE